MKDRLEKLLRQDLLDFPAYVPSSVAIADMEHVIKLDANENPFGPSPRALSALADTRVWNRYATQDELRPAIAQYAGVETENIVVGNGADEIIDLLERIVLAPGDAIVDCPPTFEMYGKYARIIGARIVDVPRREDFTIDVAAIENVKEAKIIFVANPNNPDGSLTSNADIERLLALDAMVVLDEAYVEFGSVSYADQVKRRANLILLRTFSKWAGLAGLRVGYCIAPPKITDQILRIKSPYNVNAAAIVAARASLQDAAHLQTNVKRIVAERERLSAALTKTKILQPLPSCTNFILCRVIGRTSRELGDALIRRDVLIRVFGSPRLRDYVRISVGTPEEDDALMAALREMV